MFEDLMSFEKIVVTGPQRSGTRLISHAIAEDTGHKHVDEMDWWYLDPFLRELKNDGKHVLQAPGMSHVCAEIPEDVLVVFCMRDVLDIVASETRIKWTCACNEVDKYKDKAGPTQAIQVNITISDKALAGMDAEAEILDALWEEE